MVVARGYGKEQKYKQFVCRWLRPSLGPGALPRGSVMGPKDQQTQHINIVVSHPPSLEIKDSGWGPYHVEIKIKACLWEGRCGFAHTPPLNWSPHTNFFI